MADREGFVELYRKDRDRLYRSVTFVVGDPALAAEAVDEAFVRAYERWYRVGWMQEPAGWIFRVAVNWATSWRRKLSRRPTRPIEALDTAQQDEPLDLDLVARLQQLPEKQRAVLVLRFLMDLSVTETAAALGVSVGTVKSRTHRALQQLGDRPEVLQ